MAVEKRKLKRIPTSFTRVWVSYKGDIYPGRMRNVSYDGANIGLLDHFCEVGDTFSVSIIPDSTVGEVIMFEVKKVWENEDTDGEWLIGCQFLNVTLEQKEAVEARFIKISSVA